MGQARRPSPAPSRYHANFTEICHSFGSIPVASFSIRSRSRSAHGAHGPLPGVLPYRRAGRAANLPPGRSVLFSRAPERSPRSFFPYRRATGRFSATPSVAGSTAIRPATCCQPIYLVLQPARPLLRLGRNVRLRDLNGPLFRSNFRLGEFHDFLRIIVHAVPLWIACGKLSLFSPLCESQRFPHK